MTRGVVELGMPVGMEVRLRGSDKLGVVTEITMPWTRWIRWDGDNQPSLTYFADIEPTGRFRFIGDSA